MLFFYAVKTIHTSWLVRTFSQSSVNKTPSRETVCVLHQCSGHWQVSGMWLWAEKKMEFHFLPDCKPVAYILEECLSWKPVKLCQRWISALLVCHVAVFCFFFFSVWFNCGSGGIPAPPETCVLCFPFLFFLILISLCLLFSSFSQQLPRTDLL